MLSFWHSGYLNPFILAWIFRPRYLIIFHLVQFAVSQELRNLSIPVTSPQIVYTPFVCNETAILNSPQLCAGAWQLSNSTDADSTTVSTIGPSPASSNIIPQLFFQFRAFELFITTLPSSNATVNVTISANGVVVSSTFNSSLGSARIINLPDNETSQLTINFVPSSTPTRFELGSLVINVPSDGSITSILPSQTLPPSISLPTFTTPSTISTSILTSPTSSSQAHANRRMIAQAVGLTVGLGLGLTAVAVLAFYYWKRRRQRQMNVSMQETKSGWSHEGSRHT